MNYHTVLSDLSYICLCVAVLCSHRNRIGFVLSVLALVFWMVSLPRVGCG